jgi:4a-hydroxytetrahydrobiopterin dehydratase
MQDLTKFKCVACRRGEPLVTEAEIAEFAPQIPDWHIVERDNIKRLERVFIFKTFVESLAFTNKVGEIAEAEGHHPSILTEWGKVTVTWWTRVIKGFHHNDFIMAAKTGKLFDVARLREVSH